jgi:ATP-dependent helicase/nuclease subunit B
VQWCKQKLAENTQTRLLVVTDNVAQKRGEIERAFLDFDRSGRSFEFSLGIPLNKTALGRSAFMLLQWLSGSISESDLDWLLSSGFSVIDAAEAYLLQTYVRGLRRSGLERPHWSLPGFLNQTLSATLPTSWVRRMNEAQRRLNEQSRNLKSPLEWSELVPHLLQTMGWPGQRPLSSEEFQVVRRWEAALESCAALGFDGRRITWAEFLEILAEAMEETLFAPETRDAPIQITGTAESAGLSADAIWFMGATEDAWPTAGATHPFLPIEVQREAAMPHAKAQIDWDLANSMTSRLLNSAAEVFFSFARQGEEADARPSRLIIAAAGAPQELPPYLLAPELPPAFTVSFEDSTRVAFRAPHVEGGSSVLTYQSQCGFKAFTAARLGARGWNAAEPCLTPSQRGRLLHAVLHSIWGGPKTGGIQELSELQKIENRERFIAAHVSRAMQKELKRAVRERLPARYLELEERRLCSLVAEWLEYELTRIDFKVLKTEDELTVQVAGITFDVRLDRVDQLSDESLLVIDYKTGAVKKKSWDLPRPDDVQLPLYASYGFDKNETVGGLVFAKVLRGDDLGFEGCLKDARATLDPALRGTNGLVKNKLDGWMIQDWKRHIDKLATDFLRGRADVDPREYPGTCERCDFQAICRIQEHRDLTSEDDDPEEESADE